MCACAGIRRVALLDFDVHHGNGTQACVGNTVPSLATYAFQTPLSRGSQVFPLFKPWLDFDDAEHILFARRATEPANTNIFLCACQFACACILVSCLLASMHIYCQLPCKAASCAGAGKSAW